MNKLLTATLKISKGSDYKSQFTSAFITYKLSFNQYSFGVQEQGIANFFLILLGLNT